VDVERCCSLLDSKIDEEQQRAIDSLAKVGTPAVPAIIAVLEHGETFIARRNAANALGLIDDPGAIPALVNAVGDENFEASQKAGIAVFRAGDKSGRPGIMKAMETGQNNINLLIVGSATLELLGDKQAPPLLEALTRHYEKDVAQEARDAPES
jgi:HEAT repeat protein